MPSFTSHRPLITVLVSLGMFVALGLAACTSGTSGSDSSTTSGPSASNSSASPSSPAATGCAATPGTATPAGSTSKPTRDVDGDGKADTEWIAATANGTTRFGITTASKATFFYEVTSASPIARGGFVSKVGAQFISLLTDGRSAYLHVIVNCTFAQPLNQDGAAYTFDLQNLRGNGTGVGCASDHVVGYHASPNEDGSAFTVTQTIVRLGADGRTAGNGATTTIANGAAKDDATVKTAQSVSCGKDTMQTSGVQLSS